MDNCCAVYDSLSKGMPHANEILSGIMPGVKNSLHKVANYFLEYQKRLAASNKVMIVPRWNRSQCDPPRGLIEFSPN